MKTEKQQFECLIKRLDKDSKLKLQQALNELLKAQVRKRN